jgi:hypothetical protein
MDLVKFMITFGVTALVTVFGLDRIQERRARQQHRADVLFQLEMDALQEFRQAIVAYEVAALSAYTDIYQWKGGDKTPTMRHYEVTAFGDLNAALDGLEIRFKDSHYAMDMVQRLHRTHSERHEIYHQLVVEQLDSDEEREMWLPAWNQRKGYDKLLENAKDLRRNLIEALEAHILGEEW